MSLAEISPKKTGTVIVSTDSMLHANLDKCLILFLMLKTFLVPDKFPVSTLMTKGQVFLQVA